MSEAPNKTKPADPVPPVEEAQPASTTATPIDDGRAEFEVTKLAGLRVAGRRIEGKSIRLTEEEAFAELQSGTIIRKGEKLHDMFTGKDAAKKA